MPVYIVSNESFGDNVYKIGYTQNVDKRMDQLFNTSVPTPFNIEILWRGNMDMEHDIHYRCRECRINNSREFFRFDEEKLQKVIEEVSEFAKVLYVSDRFKKYVPTKEEYYEEEDAPFLEHTAPCEEVIITLTDGRALTYGDRDYYEVQFTDNAVWIYDGKYTHNSLTMFPLHMIKQVNCQYAQTACYDPGEGKVRMKLPDNLDTSRMNNIYGD